MKTFYLSSIILILSISMYAQPDSLVAFYPFNGNANEELGSGINGVNQGANLTTDRFGHQDSAYLFISDYPSYIDLGDSFDDLFAGAGAIFSFSFWIAPNDDMLNKCIIGKYGNMNCNENGREFFISISPDGKILFQNYRFLNTSNTRQGVKGTTDIVQNMGWKHIVVTYDGTIPSSNGLERIKIYIDGVQEVTNYSTFEGDVDSMEDGPSHLGIGLHLGSTGQQCGDFAFDGKVDDIKIFNTLLTLPEVQELFNEPDPMIPVTSINESLLNSFNIYPNPFTDEFVVELNNDNRTSTIKILDLSGRVIYTKISNSDVLNINVANLRNGIYFLKVKDDSDIYLRKIIKQ